MPRSMKWLASCPSTGDFVDLIWTVDRLGRPARVIITETGVLRVLWLDTHHVAIHDRR